MRHPLHAIAIAIAILEMSGMLQAYQPSSERVHTVRRGETAYRIALENGLTVEQLLTLNPGLKPMDMPVGAILRLGPGKPGSTPKPSPLPAVSVVTEKKVVPPTPVTTGYKAVRLAPIEALPSIPNIGPPILVHLERLLPATLNPSAAPLLLPALPAKASSSSSQVSNVQKPLPPSEVSKTITPAPAFEPANIAHLDLLWPVETRTISSGWGPRMRNRSVRIVNKHVKKHVQVRFQGTHKGVDLTAPLGTDVYAALDGIVITSGQHRQYGNFVLLDHGNGITTTYGHHKRNFVREGDMVRRGQKIAEVGCTGNATGSHLHFELRVDSVPQNPLPHLNDAEEIPAELMAQNQAALPFLRR